jgi:hypothetical protein
MAIDTVELEAGHVGGEPKIEPFVALVLHLEKVDEFVFCIRV